MTYKKKTIIILFTFLSILILPTITNASVLYSQTDGTTTDSTSNRFMIKWTPISTYQAYSISVGTYRSTAVGEYNIYDTSCNKLLDGSTWDVLADGDGEQYYNISSTTPFTFTGGTTYYITAGYGVNNNITRKGNNSDTKTDFTLVTVDLGCTNEAQSGTITESQFSICDSYGVCNFTDPVTNTETRIIDFDPQDLSTTTSPVTFNLHGWVNEIDFNDSNIEITFTLHNIDQNVLLAGFLSPNDIYLLDKFVATTSGDFYFSSTTPLADGNYRLNAKVQTQTDRLWGWITDTDTIDSISHQFIVGDETFIGSISQNSFTAMNEYYANSNATTTSALMDSCNPIYGFSIGECMAYLFIPDGELLSSSLNDFREKVVTHFPLGYVTDFVRIMSTTTISSMPVLEAELPSALGFGTPELELNLNGVLDFVLEADGGEFTTATTTFFETTNYYWKILVYILTAFYLLSRIVGKQFIDTEI